MSDVIEGVALIDIFSQEIDHVRSGRNYPPTELTRVELHASLCA